MEKIDLRHEIKKQKVTAGTVLILQGETVKAMNMLHSGLAEVLSCRGKADQADAEGTIANSIRVGLIKGESIYGIIGIREEGPYETSIRAVTDCIVSIIPIRQDEMMRFLQSRISLNLQVLRALTQRIESAIFLFNNYKYLWHKFASIADTLALAGDHKLKLEHVEEASRESGSLAEYGAWLRQLTGSKGVATPELWDYNLFLGRTQQALELYRNQDQRRIEGLVDYQQFLFIKRLVQKSDEALVPLFRNDEPLNFYILQFLSRTLESMVQHNLELVNSIDGLIGLLFPEDGWINQTLATQGGAGEKVTVFNHYLAKFCWRCRQDTRKLLGVDLLKRYPVYSSLREFQKLSLETGPGHKREKESVTAAGGLAKYKNLLKRILDFSDLNEAFIESFSANIKAFRGTENKLANTPELKKLRSELADQYWKLYETCFLKIIDTDLKGFVPGIMLHFGLVDETMVSKQELTLIDAAYARNLYTDDGISVMTLPYFLERIYRAELNPSITEMGQSFREILKRQSKMSKSEREKVYLYEDTAEDRVRFELRNVAIETAKLLYGSKQKSVPFLCSETFLGTPDRLFLEPEVFAARIADFRERDFSVFYREVVLRHKFGTDFVYKEVTPNFVLYPVTGSRMMMWQELDGTKKESPGRIFFPLFFSEKIEEAVPTIFAQFRWELQKIIAGVKWTDPVEGGIVGNYYDYINFYRKNPKLSAEAKQNLKEFIAKTRSDRDRFVADYLIWLNYEYEGRLRMNPAVREIFYRYVPFRRELREEMAKKPLFSDLEMKYQNRVRKELLRLETRKKRFEKADAEIPGEILDYIEFLNT